jgi:dTMP kinase
MAPRGRFITLEGGEGAGKSTQLRFLADAIAATGRPVVRTREPGGSDGADILRELLLSGRHDWAPLAEVMLHFASRAEHVARVIEPALASGAWVVCDRFADSTMVYQGWGLGADRDVIAALTAMMGVTPDLTLVLDVAVETTQSRLASRGALADRYERLGAAFFERIRDGFHDVVARHPGRCVMLSGEGGVAEVGAAMWDVVRQRFGELA